MPRVAQAVVRAVPEAKGVPEDEEVRLLNCWPNLIKMATDS